VSGVADFFQAVVKAAHCFGGFDIYRVYFFIFYVRISGKASEKGNIIFEFRQGEGVKIGV
jgi:hypothetical protein